MIEYFLYCVTNKLNNKKYIGITKDPHRRWKEHQNPSSSCRKLRNSIQFHGVENFSFKVLVCGSEEYIMDLEKKAIDAYDTISNGYNLVYGDPRTRLGHHPETQARMTASIREYYKNNPGPMLGKISKKREPIYCRGFIFPSTKLAKQTLGIKAETLREYLKVGMACKLDNEEQISLVNRYDFLQYLRTKRQKARENAIGILSKVLKLHRYKKVSEHHIKNNPMKNVVGAKHPNSRPVVIEGVGYASISTAVRITVFSKSILEKRIKKNIKGFEYFDMNKHQHLTLIDG